MPEPGVSRLRRSRQLDLGAAVAVALLAFGYRFLEHHGFANDDYVHLARAQAMLAGDWPIRDYTEEGVPLYVAISAVMQWLFGQSPLPEVLFVAGSLALAAGITCWLSTQLTGSRALGVAAGLLQIIATPRPYGQLKILVFPVFLLAAWWYLKQPGVRRLALLAAWTALSFLLRHDLGVYIGLGTAMTILFGHWRDGYRFVLRQAAVYGVLALAAVSPYLVYVEWNIGLIQYLRVGVSVSEYESGRQRRELPRFTPLKPGPLLTRVPIDADRRPMVHLGSVVAGPPIVSALTPENGVAFLFYVAWALPVAGLMLWAVLRLRSSTPRGSERGIYAGAVIPVLCVLAAACDLAFIRELLGHRIADVYGTLPILAVWCVAAVASLPRARGARRTLAATMGVAVLLPVFLMTAVIGVLMDHLDDSLVLRGPRAAIARAREVVLRTTAWPWRYDWPAGNDWRVARYVHDCTQPGDRLLVAASAPQFNFFSGRVFAGGETILLMVLRPPETVEPGVLARLEQQSVPIILAEAQDWPFFVMTYPRIASHIEARYRAAGVADFGTNHQITVWVERSRSPSGTDPEFGFPCFAK